MGTSGRRGRPAASIQPHSAAAFSCAAGQCSVAPAISAPAWARSSISCRPPGPSLTVQVPDRAPRLGQPRAHRAASAAILARSSLPGSRRGAPPRYPPRGSRPPPGRARGSAPCAPMSRPLRAGSARRTAAPWRPAPAAPRGAGACPPRKACPPPWAPTAPRPAISSPWRTTRGVERAAALGQLHPLRVVDHDQVEVRGRRHLPAAEAAHGDHRAAPPGRGAVALATSAQTSGQSAMTTASARSV
jgi:hypothetical protein